MYTDVFVHASVNPSDRLRVAAEKRRDHFKWRSEELSPTIRPICLKTPMNVMFDDLKVVAFDVAKDDEL